MHRIGCHISSAGGYLAMGERAVALGANTFAFFTRNPRAGSAKALDPEEALAFQAFCRAHDIDRIVAHAPYTLNACSAKENVREFARMVFEDDLKRMELTPGHCYNFHPGSHIGQGVETGIEQIAALLNDMLWPEMTTTVLLETMAGKGSEIGGRFEELRAIRDKVHLKEHLGVCLDTCHILDGGYDIENHLDDVLDEFDRIVGLSCLKAVHLNNSVGGLGCHKDRHAKIEEGALSREAITRVLCHPALRDLPFILETPNDEAGYAAEIRLLRGWCGEA